jgi:hypothetical protein
MRPALPAGYRPPAPPTNPQIGRATPTNEEGVASGVRHSRETLILAPHPFQYTDALEAAGVLPLGHWTHYDGTPFYYTTNDLHGGGEPWTSNQWSASFDHWESAPGEIIAGTGVANPDAEASARFIVSILNINYRMARGVPYNLRTTTLAGWPWKAWAEQVLYESVLRWAVTIERGYPAGTGYPNGLQAGGDAARTSPIWDIPQSAGGGNTETTALIGYTARIFTPGERGYDMLPARFGLNRAVMPLGNAPLETTQVIPYVYGNLS